jgi:peptidyl-prolyl cis-trans isomerase A (cyclophilin A)
MCGQSRNAAIVTQGRGYAGPDHVQRSALGVRAMALPWAWQDFDMTNALTATLRTNRGTVVVRLFPDHAPKTVRNFVELAEGGREWTDPRTRATGAVKLYDGTIFHRVIPRFMIQGGDPLGTGTGGPGYKFADEIHPDLRFDRPYLLAMANAGPGTNGSQFFITTVPTPHLNGKHTIFGEVISGSDVVEAISNVPTGRNDRPANDVVLESVVVQRDGDAAESGS